MKCLNSPIKAYSHVLASILLGLLLLSCDNNNKIADETIEIKNKTILNSHKENRENQNDFNKGIRRIQVTRFNIFDKNNSQEIQKIVMKKKLKDYKRTIEYGFSPKSSKRN